MLKIVRSLIDKLNNNNIGYCHWKSNAQLDNSVNGETDLDLLFQDSEKNDVKEILKNVGFRLFKSPWWKKYQHIEDYIGIDLESGKLVHVHAHFKLVLGEKRVKSYHLNWEKEILDNKIFNKKNSIYCTSYEMELLLLIIRMTIKSGGITNRMNLYESDIDNYNNELKWLVNNIDAKKFTSLVKSKICNKASNQINKIVNSEFDKDQFRNLKSILNITLRKYQRFGIFKKHVNKQLRLFAHIITKITNNIGLSRFSRSRRFTNKAVIVALIGADGAGKSTQISRINKELGKKIDVENIYMGSGDGDASFHRSIVKILNNIWHKISNQKSKKLAYSEKKHKQVSNGKNSIKTIGRIIKALSIAIEKKSKIKKAYKFKSKGIVVICDRYPQSSVMNYNDGPKLSEFLNSNNIILKKLSRYEYRIYNMGENLNPDIVIKLIGDTNLLYQRRPEMSLKEIEKKQNSIKELKFKESVQVYEIDSFLRKDEITNKIIGLIGQNMYKNI